MDIVLERQLTKADPGSTLYPVQTFPRQVEGTGIGLYGVKIRMEDAATTPTGMLSPPDLFPATETDTLCLILY
jgi:hypothetical protein